MQSIIVTGNPVDGFTYYGPFKAESESDEALSWAEKNLDGEWWIAALAPPDEEQA